MSLLYKPANKEILNTRNKIFLDYAIPELYNNGFTKAPFSTAWFGRDNLADFTYELVRLKEKRQIELLVVHINKGDSHIKFFLNIFDMSGGVEDIKDLENKDALKFHLPPLSLTKMRLRNDDYRFIPIVTPLFYREHKIAPYFTKSGFNFRVNELCNLIRRDCKNINKFVSRWHEKHILQTVHLE